MKVMAAVIAVAAGEKLNVAAVCRAAGLNQAVYDALIVLAAGVWEPAAIAAGVERVRTLESEMDEGRRRRLVRLGFAADDAAAFSALHTRNSM